MWSAAEGVPMDCVSEVRALWRPGIGECFRDRVWVSRWLEGWQYSVFKEHLAQSAVICQGLYSLGGRGKGAGAGILRFVWKWTLPRWIEAIPKFDGIDGIAGLDLIGVGRGFRVRIEEFMFAFEVGLEGIEHGALIWRFDGGVTIPVVFASETAFFELLEVGDGGVELMLESGEVAAEEIEAVSGGE